MAVKTGKGKNTMYYVYLLCVFVPALLTDANKERLLKEVSIMISFDHPNVMSLKGMCFDGEVPLLIMPFMTGGSVLDYVGTLSGTTDEQLTSDLHSQHVASDMFVLFICPLHNSPIKVYLASMLDLQSCCSLVGKSPHKPTANYNYSRYYTPQTNKLLHQKT